MSPRANSEDSLVDWDDNESLAATVTLILFAIALAWVYVVRPFVLWLQENLALILASLAGMGVLIAALWSLSVRARDRNRSDLYARLCDQIARFEPSSVYSTETGYHAELQGWLKQQFPQAMTEQTRGASRPDIVVDDIAIEVKGPTTHNDLNSLTTKCLKYSQHYAEMLVVLFRPQVSDAYYEEVVSGLRDHFPGIEIIRID